MTFRVGQKVACIDDAGLCCEFLIEVPRAGKVYEIRGFAEGIRFDGSVGTGILLCGVHNPLASTGREHCFDPRRFRPVVERKTSIEIFTAMLNPSKQEVVA